MAKQDKVLKFDAYWISFLGVMTVLFMERAVFIPAIADSEQAFSTLPKTKFLF